MAIEGFSSPSMRARAHLVRGLAFVDELERAWVRRDYWTARELARKAGEEVRAAGQDFDAAWSHTGELETIEPADAPPAPSDSAEPESWRSDDGGETWAEERLAHGDR
jgi:hypothetical protein